MYNTNNRKYYLMHNDKKILYFDFDGNINILNSKFMPYGLYIEDNDDIATKTNNILNIYNWLARRVITIDRKYSKEIYNYLNIAQNSDDRTKALFSISYHALSLTDVYWVKEQNEKISFKDINLFDNSLNNSFIDIFLRGKNLTISNKDLDSRDISTSGQCPKAWFRDKNSKLVLYKDGSKLEVENEVLASKIVTFFNLNAVKYTIGKYKNKIVSRCNIITNKEYSLLNSFDLKIYCLNNNIDFYKYIEKIDGYNYHMMNIIDYLIGNIDRHLNNWGVLIDNKNNKILRLYDLMDFNKSFKNYNNITGAKCLTNELGLTQLEAAIMSIKKVGLNMCKPIPNTLFKDNKSKAKMFYKRLNILKKEIKNI